MKTYRTRVLLITEVAPAHERQAYEKSSSAMDRLQEHLQLALEETRVVLAGRHLGAGSPAAGDQRKYGIELELHIEVNSAQRAGEELKKALPLLTTYARLALEGSRFQFRELQAGEIFLKRY